MQYRLWAKYSKSQEETGKIRTVLYPFISLNLGYPDKKTAAMYLLKIFKEKFHTLPKKTHRDRAGCSDDQTKISKIKYLILEKYLVLEAENVVTTTTTTKSTEESA